MTEPGENIKEPIRRVCHADLERAPASEYTSECPACRKGLLTMKRDPVMRKLLPSDTCTYCGQRFFYTDIHDVM